MCQRRIISDPLESLNLSATRKAFGVGFHLSYVQKRLPLNVASDLFKRWLVTKLQESQKGVFVVVGLIIVFN